MTGRRIYQDGGGVFYADAGLTERIGWLSSIADGDYWLWGGEWAAQCPGGLLATLRGHKVVEHDDGTITAAPSILVRRDGAAGRREWHGFLERGVWRSV